MCSLAISGGSTRCMQALFLYGNHAIASCLDNQDIISISTVSMQALSFFSVERNYRRIKRAFEDYRQASHFVLHDFEQNPKSLKRKYFGKSISFMAHRTRGLWHIYFCDNAIVSSGVSKLVHLGYDVRRKDLVVIASVHGDERIRNFVYHEILLSQRRRPCGQKILDSFQIVMKGTIPRVTNKFDYLVMPWAAGGDLSHFITNSSIRMTNTQLYELCLQLAFEVKKVHKQNLVHCDIKAENILVHRQGIQLADFGVCIKVNDIWINTGTIRISPPEVFNRPMRIETDVDIWSLALVFIRIYSRGLAAPHEGIMRKAWNEKNYEPLKKLTDRQWVNENVVLSSKYGFDRLKPLILGMLNYNHWERPLINDVVDFLIKQRSFFYANPMEVPVYRR